jgi:hypothetical protein
LELPRFRGQFLVFVIFVLCIDLTKRSLTARKRGQKIRGDFLVESRKNRPRIKLQGAAISPDPWPSASAGPLVCDRPGSHAHRRARHECSATHRRPSSADGSPRSLPSTEDPFVLDRSSVGHATRKTRFSKSAAIGTSPRPNGWPGSPSRTRRALRGPALRREPGRGF